MLRATTVITGGGTLTWPTITDTVVAKTTADTLTNKTLTAPTINGAIAGTTFGAFTAWTPTIVQNGSRTLTINWATYIAVGKFTCVNANVTITNAGTGGFVIQMQGLPVSVKNTAARACIGSFVYERAGVTIYSGSVVATSSTTLSLISTANGDFLGILPNFAVANGDILSITITYEAV